ncbi:hypothetical protein D3C79_1094400 [compost metagenome]
MDFNRNFPRGDVVGRLFGLPGITAAAPIAGRSSLFLDLRTAAAAACRKQRSEQQKAYQYC